MGRGRKEVQVEAKVHCVLSCSLPFFSFFDSVLLLKPEFTDWLGSLSIHQSENLFVLIRSEITGAHHLAWLARVLGTSGSGSWGTQKSSAGL